MLGTGPTGRNRLAALLVAGFAVGQCATAAAIPAPNDPGYPQQIGPGGALAALNYPQALRDLGSTSLANVTVAALDTGVDLTHSDLASKLVTFAAPVTVAPFPGDGSNNGGTAPAGAHGWNFLGTWATGDYGDLYGAPGNADPTDPNNTTEGVTGHGTAVTGIMAAAFNNGVGGAGIAPNARILAIRSCWDYDTCPGFVEPQAMQFAAQRGARVVSMSWNMDQSSFDDPNGNGGSGGSKAAIKAAPNTLFVALAGGNGGPALLPDTERPCGLSATEPNVICVSTSSPTNGLDCGEYSRTIVDLAVPTENNYTTLNSGAFSATGCATSYASPTLAGAAAILFGLDPTATAAQVKAALMDSAHPAAAWAGLSVTGGVLDLDAAVKLFAQRRGITLVPDTPLPPLPPPPPLPPVLPPPSGSVSVGPAHVSGTVATVLESCSGAAGASCSLVLTMSVTETTRSGKLLAVSAKARTIRKTVTVGRTPITLGAGQQATVQIVLNTAGKRLLSRFHKLKVKLTGAQNANGRTSTVSSQTVTFKAGKKH